ncbi:hypothetical protein DBT_0150 [Dissulfuribacter thermophilus]|uniref:Uncharacterized protein n=1 Tax=Dissulfuribacter thermophilus TaxID=1156395 RepID=A0A1B9F8X1_9BACT|nr:hypothetical protein DBT_0150 [Dissulfuribacter thermophilus]
MSNLKEFLINNSPRRIKWGLLLNIPRIFLTAKENKIISLKPPLSHL